MKNAVDIGDITATDTQQCEHTHTGMIIFSNKKYSEDEVFK